MLVIEPTNGRELTRWADINWSAVEANVRRLQGRIYRAAANGEQGKVKNLQKLLIRALSAKLKAIRQVTQENRGKHTPGIDGVVCDTPKARLVLLKEGLTFTGYRPKPARRVCIPKANGKQRPLGILTVKDRVMQALIKLALEPEWESRFEANSYGFRPGRCCMDAIQALHTTLNQKGSSQGILDADISNCFNEIDQEVLLKRLPVFTTTLRRWLKAGVVELGQYHDTDAGTPQGGVASPLMANIALDGMERLFGCEDANGNPIPPSLRKGENRGISLIRYADDVAVTAPSREVLEQYVVPKLKAFLAGRGLRLSEAKTRIVHIDEGFHFLGFEIRRFRGTLLTRPEKAKVIAHLGDIKAYLNAHKQTPAVAVIKALNPKLRGWANYYRHSAASKTFAYTGHRMWQMLWRWAKRRHPNKPRKWVKARYFRADGYWTFHEGNAQLCRQSAISITRYVKVTGRASPMDPKQRGYWTQRKKWQAARATYQRKRLAMLREQNNTCGLCGVVFWPNDPIDEHHLIPRHQGGDDALANRQLVHRWCHHAYHQRHGYNVVEARAV